MNSTPAIPMFEGATLAQFTYSWRDAQVDLLVEPVTTAGDTLEAVRVRGSGVTRIIGSSECNLRGRASIQRCAGPLQLDEETIHLRLELSNGDVVELDVESLELLPAMVTVPVARPEPVPLPHLHDAGLRKIELRPEEATAELVIGPVLWHVRETLGASHVRLRFRGVQRVVYPRRTPWDYSSTSILKLRGPVWLGEAMWHVRVVMQDGNEVELDYASVDVDPFEPDQQDLSR